MTPRALAIRLYRDFLMPSRLTEYRSLLEEALREGYQVHSLGEFWELSGQGIRRPSGRHLLLRHDVDTDLVTARRIWEVECALGVKSSYFFRLSTADAPFMRELAAGGVEAGYHYEELAAISKQRRLQTHRDVQSALPEIRELFVAHLESLREQTGLPLRVAAAHGDWINRRLGISNEEILRDPALRSRARIDLEAYDTGFTCLIDRRFADLGPVLWTPGEPARAIQDGLPVLQLLTHPRQWRVNVRANLSENALRAVEGIRYSLGI